MSKKIIFQQDYSYTRLIVWVISTFCHRPNTAENMHRVVTLNTLCSIASIYFATQHNRFFSEPPNRLFSEPPTFFEENDVLSNLWTTLFFARYCVTCSQVRWANLLST